MICTHKSFEISSIGIIHNLLSFKEKQTDSDDKAISCYSLYDFNIGDTATISDNGSVYADKEHKLCTYPDVCPVCGAPLYSGKDDRKRCTSFNCRATLAYKIFNLYNIHDVPLSGSTRHLIDMLILRGHITSLDDIFHLSPEEYREFYTEQYKHDFKLLSDGAKYIALNTRFWHFTMISAVEADRDIADKYAQLDFKVFIDDVLNDRVHAVQCPYFNTYLSLPSVKAFLKSMLAYL